MASTALPTQASTASIALMAAALYAGMSHHIRVCKVDDDNIVLAGLDTVYQLVADCRCAHLRF